MNKAVEAFLSLIKTEYEDYSDFETTPAGEPYWDELSSFCMGFDDLSIPDLGIDFVINNAKKKVTDHYESKTYYDMFVSFQDKISGDKFVLTAGMFKAMDDYFGSIAVAPLKAKEAKPKKSQDAAAKKTKVPKLSAEEAQEVVAFLGAFFEVAHGEVMPNSNTPEGEAFADLMISPFVGDTLDIGPYSFTVTEAEEEITDESDGWSLGEGFIKLKEAKRKFKVTIGTSLTMAQSTEITGVLICCQDAEFELNAEG